MALGKPGSRAMASGPWPMPRNGARWTIFAPHTFPRYLLRLERAARRPQGPRIDDFGKLHRAGAQPIPNPNGKPKPERRSPETAPHLCENRQGRVLARMRSHFIFTLYYTSSTLPTLGTENYSVLQFTPTGYFGLNGFLETAKTLCTCEMFTQ